MIKILPIWFLHSILCSFCLAQAGEWTWMHGDTILNSGGSFGVQGVFDPGNKPPGLYEPGHWTDNQGNFWLFGGNGSAEYNTLWKYDPSINQWAWISGSSSTGQFGSYGTIGIPSPTNIPGARFCPATWIDTLGNLWLYGGFGRSASASSIYLDDVWKYDIGTNEWTWMAGTTSGNTNPVFGTLGVFDAANSPGGRLETDAAFVDTDGNFWLFGGLILTGLIDDLWKYDLSLNQWAWMKGPNLVNQAAVYGSLGVPDPNNHPGGRRVYDHWQDDNGNFYLFGGQSPSNTCYSDLWSIDPDSLEWTWISGSNILNSNNNNHDSLCEIDNSYHPGARMENKCSWTDGCNHFWTFGGLNAFSSKYYNDLWFYDPVSNEWSWVSGSTTSNEKAKFGVLGVADSSNHPGARYGAIPFMDSTGSFWLFGGTGFASGNGTGKLSDLWKYIPDALCHGCTQKPASSFLSSNTTVCEKFCIDFYDASSNNPSSWQWEFSGGTPSSSTDQNPTQICYNTTGTFDVTLITTNAYGSDTLILQGYITVNATPPFPTITQNGNVLTSSPAAAYQWQLNSIDIGGATNQSYTITQSGFYAVIVTDSNGCQNSASIDVVFTGIEFSADVSISVYPNPTDGIFTIDLSGNQLTNLEIEVLNAFGQKVFLSSEKSGDGRLTKDIDLNAFPDGVYVLRIKQLSFIQKVLLQ